MVRPVDFDESNVSGLRACAVRLVESKKFVAFVMWVIVFNAITLGLETDSGMVTKYGTYLHVLDKAFLAIFIFELLTKLFAYRLSFFKVGWNVFDFIVVGISLVPASGPFVVIRAFRVLRVLRIMSVVPQMRNVITALLDAIPGMTSIAMVLMVVFYVSSVMATQIFGTHSDPQMQELFGSISSSMYSLFQMMTLENWAEGIATPTLEHFPWALVFFIPFIVVTSFAVLNLFIGIIVDAMQNIYKKEAIEHIDEDPIHQQIQILREEVRELKEFLKEK